jgi:hypothetical protein
MKTTVMMVLLLLAGVCAMGQADGGLEDVEAGMTLQMTAPILPGGARKFMLKIQTNDVYECTNFAVENETWLQGNRLIVKVEGIRRTKPCGEGMGPAASFIDLSELGLGDYKVSITINRQVFKADLLVTENYFDFKIPENVDQSLLRIYNGRLNMIPGGTIWGKCEYTSKEKKAKALKLMADLEKAGATKTALPIGNYDEFYLHTVGTTDEKSIKGERFEYPFVYSFNGDMASLQQILNGYSSDIKVTLKNDKGEVFRN